MEKIYEQVEKNIDALVEKGVGWSECAAAGQMQEAREGRLKLNFYDREIPADWIRDVKGKKVLCLAGAGGLQAPLLACAGAEVTVLDLSDKMFMCAISSTMKAEDITRR